MSKYIRKCKDKYNRKEVIQFSMKNEIMREWSTVGEIHRELGFDKSAILRCCNGKQQRSYWFIWKFKEDVLKQSNNQIESEGKATIVPKAIQQVEGSCKEGN